MLVPRPTYVPRPLLHRLDRSFACFLMTFAGTGGAMPDIPAPGTGSPAVQPGVDPTPGDAAPAGPARVGGLFIALYASAYIGTSLVFLAPLLVSLALKVNSL